MKINFNKKIIIGIIIFLALIAVGLFYFYFSYKIFSGEKISFLYPREVIFEDISILSGGLYKEYRIRHSYVSGPDGSYIYVHEPIKNDYKHRKLADHARPEFVYLIKPIIINGLEGEFLTYRLDEQLPGDQPVHADITQIYLSNSEYPNTPITLSYSRSDVDNSLDKTWNLILKTLKY